MASMNRMGEVLFILKGFHMEAFQLVDKVYKLFCIIRVITQVCGG